VSVKNRAGVSVFSFYPKSHWAVIDDLC
jgi:hypothetical protein